MDDKSNSTNPEEDTKKPQERSINEQRVRELTFVYYSMPNIRKAIFDFSQNRECIPRYYESFGKRPDVFQFEGDILEHVKKGATSFHCSEEIWEEPLELSTELSKKELDDIRIGWDLLLDIDSKYLEYSKIYTELLIEVLNFHGIKNFSVKFSGNKGFHVIVPWRAFPQLIYNEKTKNMFPEWPRIICEYLSEMIKPKLAERIFENESLKDIAKKTGKKEDELIINECLSCHRAATKKDQITWSCTNCKDIGEVIRMDNRRIQKCPECRKPLIEKSRKEILFCEFCNLNSEKAPERFTKRKEKTESLIDADLVLVAPRHLFRMPYSLHEKTALSSIVIDKEKIMDFQITDAKPLKFEVKNFYPVPHENEAKELLLQALDWYEQKERQDNTFREKTPQFIKGDYKKITISNPTEDIMPPQIQLLLKGINQDGRKRALFVLLSFFKSLGVPDNEIERRIFEWNEKNYLPLKKGYIMSQLNWYKKAPARLPPNFNNPIYRELGVDKPDSFSMQTKNPVNYAIKKYFALKKTFNNQVKI